MKNTTDTVRVIVVVTWTLTILTALAGWWAGKDPSQLGVVVAWITAGLGAAEASNVGKRATWKPEAAQMEERRHEADAIREDG